MKRLNKTWEVWKENGGTIPCEDCPMRTKVGHIFCCLDPERIGDLGLLNAQGFSECAEDSCRRKATFLPKRLEAALLGRPVK